MGKVAPFSIPMDTTLALRITTAAGLGYSVLTLGMPKMYLTQANLDGENEDMQLLTRNIGGGILGLTSMTYMASTRGADCKELALCSLSTAFIAYTLCNLEALMRKPNMQ